MQSANRKVIFISSWSLLFLISVAFACFEPRLQFGQGEPIAELTDMSGSVQFRGRQIPIWSYAVAHQRLFEADVVATGDAGSTVVQFPSGRTIHLDQNTQIVLTTIRDDSGKNFAITLISGTLTAGYGPINEVFDSSSIVIKAGEKEIRIANPAVKLSISKIGLAPVDLRVDSGKVEVRDVTKQTPTVVDATSSSSPILLKAADLLSSTTLSAKALHIFDEHSRIDQSAAAAELKIPHLIVPREPVPMALQIATNAMEDSSDDSTKEEQKKELVVPEVLDPRHNSRLWTELSFKRGNWPSLTVRLKRSVTVEQAQTAACFVRLGRLDSYEIFQSDMSHEEQQEISIPDSALANFAAPADQDSDLPIMLLHMSPGVETIAGSVVGAELSNVYLGSLSDFPDRPLLLRLQHLNARHQNSTWFLESTDLSADEADISIHLTSGAEITRLTSFVQGAEKFAFEFDALPPVEAAFVVKTGQIIAVVDLRRKSKETWDLLRRAFAADFIYSGRRSAFVEGPPLSGDGNRISEQMLKDTVQMQQAQIYVLRSRKIVGIETKLMKENIIAQNLVIDTAEALFVEPVKIESIR